MRAFVHGADKLKEQRRFRLHLLSGAHPREVYEKWVAAEWQRRPALPTGQRPEDQADIEFLMELQRLGKLS